MSTNPITSSSSSSSSSTQSSLSGPLTIDTSRQINEVFRTHVKREYLASLKHIIATDPLSLVSPVRSFPGEDSHASISGDDSPPSPFQ